MRFSAVVPLPPSPTHRERAARTSWAEVVCMLLCMSFGASVCVGVKFEDKHMLSLVEGLLASHKLFFARVIMRPIFLDHLIVSSTCQNLTAQHIFCYSDCKCSSNALRWFGAVKHSSYFHNCLSCCVFIMRTCCATCFARRRTNCMCAPDSGSQ